MLYRRQINTFYGNLDTELLLNTKYNSAAAAGPAAVTLLLLQLLLQTDDAPATPVRCCCRHVPVADFDNDGSTVRWTQICIEYKNNGRIIIIDLCGPKETAASSDETKAVAAAARSQHQQ